MNRCYLIRFSLGLLFLTGISSSAQDETPPAPPILAPVGDMKWTITIQPKPSALPGMYNPWLLEYSHGGDWTRMVATSGQSQKNEWWISHGYLLTRSANDNSVVFQRLLSFVPPAPYASSHFFGVDQIKTSDKRGVTTFQGTRCSYYSSNPPAEPSQPAPSSSAGYEAWFDAKTGLPTGYRKGGITYLYEFVPAVPNEIQVPADFKTIFDHYLEALRAAGLAPANSN